MATDNEILKRIYNPNVAHVLNPASLQHLAREWLKEDTPSFDFAGFVVGEKEESAVILIKSPGVLAGCPFVDAIFKELDCKVEWLEKEGAWIEPTKTVATVSGKVRHLLLGERVALNCLCRASGIATYCKKLLKIAENCKWGGELAGTRKTTPGFRMVEKYALLVGGVSTHRYDLSSMIMLKDNHIWTAGSIAQVCIFGWIVFLKIFPTCLCSVWIIVIYVTQMMTVYCRTNFPLEKNLQLFAYWMNE